MSTWHHQSSNEILSQLETTPQGLSPEEARRRLEEHGPNKLEEAKRESALKRLLRQFHDVLIYILIIAAGLTAYLGEWVDTAVIMAVVIINAVIGFVQEGKAEEAMEMIRKMLSPDAVVLRDGKRKKIDAEELVKGDVVWLESGDRVPADVRLLEVNGLAVEEAALTGESDAVVKQEEFVAEEALIGDRLCMAFSGTMVVRGTARAVVVATAADTEMGKIGTMVSEVEKLQTPLLRKIDRFGLWLSLIILIVAAALFGYGWFTATHDVADLFMLVVSLAVAAIPEGLPAIMTITLALGVRSMANKNAIVRRLPAVETLGSVTVICSDKTGTLTRNEMSARKVFTNQGLFEVRGEGAAPDGEVLCGNETLTEKQHTGLARLARAALLCNDAELGQDPEGTWKVEGEPTEAALVVMAARAGLFRDEEAHQYERIGAVPFESQRRYMATLHESPGAEKMIFLKGAPERILSMCSTERGDSGKDQKLDPDKWNQRGDEIAAKGYRVLAIAERSTADSTTSIAPEKLGEEFVLLGLVGLMDPPRDEAIDAVAQAQSAGVKVKMITGDHASTARSIGAMMNIGVGTEAITGHIIDDASDEELEQLVMAHDIFARTSPEHKLRIVQALQRQRQVVSMTGDGVNDAPALRRADVGVAMGIKGTEATKQAADMVLADDNFVTIAAAIHEGRKIYDNLKKTILFLLPTNGAEALMVIAALVLALEHIPITPVQILWVNMITAITLALALAFEPAEANIMKRPPRPAREPLIDGYAVLRIIGIAVLIGALSLTAFFDVRASQMSVEVARTAAINTLVAGQLFYLFSSRFLTESSASRAGLLGNPVALIAAAILIVMQLSFTHLSVFQGWFGTDHLTLEQWGRVAVAGLAVFILAEVEKLVRRTWGPGR